MLYCEPPVPKRAFIGAGKSHLGFDTMSFQLILASLDKDVARRRAAETINALLGEPGPTSLLERFFNGPGRSSGPSGSVPAA